MTEAMAQLPQYQCHKKVWALKIKAVERDAITMLHFENDGFAPIQVSYDFDVKHNPQPGGYYVQYDDGYKSFSPADAFESGYTLIKPTSFQDRVRTEKVELDEKLTKLAAFFPTDTFTQLPPEERDRLTAQHAAMCDYSNCLSERIDAFA